MNECLKPQLHATAILYHNILHESGLLSLLKEKLQSIISIGQRRKRGTVGVEPSDPKRPSDLLDA